MFDDLIKTLNKNKANWEMLNNLLIERDIRPKTILLKEGEVSNSIFYIKKGCLRMWFNKDGKDITFQFFFERQAVASIESFLNKQPSHFYIESVEPSTVVILDKVNFDLLNKKDPAIEMHIHKILLHRFGNYAKLFLSRIKDTPQERYEDLIRNNPEIVKRIPQHYIASYLGISPISLSRIKNRR